MKKYIHGVLVFLVIELIFAGFIFIQGNPYHTFKNAMASILFGFLASFFGLMCYDLTE